MLNGLINNLLKNRPDVQNDPTKMEALQTILNGDAQKGQEIAKQICQQKNANPQDATNQANNWFNGLMNGNK